MERKIHIGHNYAHDMLVELSLQVQHREPKNDCYKKEGKA